MTPYTAALWSIGAALLVSSAVALYAMLRGYQLLRRLLRDVRDEDSLLLKSPIAPGISVITSPPDASAESRAWVRRLLDLHYGDHEIVVVLDGFEPLERDRWLAEFRLGPVSRKASKVLESKPVRGVYESSDPLRIVLVDKERGGWSEALNTGVNVACYPVIGWVPAGCRFEPNLLLRLIRPMLEEPDQTVAVCGLSAGPVSRGLAAGLSACDFLRTWLIRCAAFRGWNMLVPVPGAPVLVRREAVIAAHGFRAGFADLCLRLHGAARIAHADYRVALIADPVIFPPEPSNWRELGRQITRDQAGLGQLAFRWARGAGVSGRAAILWFRLFKPLIETAGYPVAIAGLMLEQLDLSSALFFLLASAGGGMVTSTAAVVLPALARDRGTEPAQLKRLFLLAVLENLGYRQIRNLRMIVGFFGGKKKASEGGSRIAPGSPKPAN